MPVLRRLLCRLLHDREGVLHTGLGALACARCGASFADLIDAGRTEDSLPLSMQRRWELIEDNKGPGFIGYAWAVFGGHYPQGIPSTARPFRGGVYVTGEPVYDLLAAESYVNADRIEQRRHLRLIEDKPREPRVVGISGRRQVERRRRDP